MAGSSLAQVFLVSTPLVSLITPRCRKFLTLVVVHVAISKSKLARGRWGEQPRQTHTRFGARQRYVNCQAACSKS